jgi:hypothetical protein
VPDPAQKAQRAAGVLAAFGWGAIVDRTMEVYESALRGWKPGSARPVGAGRRKHVELGGRR